MCFTRVASSAPRAHLLDFGLSTAMFSRGRLFPRNWRRVRKTHPWYAPEFLRGFPVDGKADVVAYGYLLKKTLLLLTGPLGSNLHLWGIVEGSAKEDPEDRLDLAAIRSILKKILDHA